MGGVFMVPVSAEVRQNAGIAGGDRVEMKLELDTATRDVTIPPELARALEGDADAKRVFEALSNSRKQTFTLPIEKAKTHETRDRNVAKVMAELRAGTK